MTIDKALQHIQWRFSNGIKPTKRDIEAFNSIIDYKELQESKNMSENETMAKLWIHQLILLARSNMYNGERCIQVIDEILDKSVYEWCLILQNEIPIMRFNSIDIHKYQIDKENLLNRTKIAEINKKIVAENETELTEALKVEPSIEQIIKFVSKEINRTITKYEK